MTLAWVCEGSRRHTKVRTRARPQESARLASSGPNRTCSSHRLTRRPGPHRERLGDQPFPSRQIPHHRTSPLVSPIRVALASCKPSPGGGGRRRGAPCLPNHTQSQALCGGGAEASRSASVRPRPFARARARLTGSSRQSGGRVALWEGRSR